MLFGFNKNHHWEGKANKITFRTTLKTHRLVLIIKGALNVPSMHRLGPLQPVLRETPGEIEERHRKAIWGTHQVLGITLEQGIPLQILKRAMFPFYFLAGSTPPRSQPQPLLAGWLLEAKATALPDQFLAAANLARDSADPEGDGLQVVVALFVKPAPSEAWGWAEVGAVAAAQGRHPTGTPTPAAPFWYL